MQDAGKPIAIAAQKNTSIRWVAVCVRRRKCFDQTILVLCWRPRLRTQSSQNQIDRLQHRQHLLGLDRVMPCDIRTLHSDYFGTQICGVRDVQDYRDYCSHRRRGKFLRGGSSSIDWLGANSDLTGEQATAGDASSGRNSQAFPVTRSEHDNERGRRSSARRQNCVLRRNFGRGISSAICRICSFHQL